MGFFSVHTSHGSGTSLNITRSELTNMIKYEYIEIHLGREGYSEKLNRWGEFGWELVTVSMVLGNVVAFFKRPLPDTQTVQEAIQGLRNILEKYDGKS